MLTNTKAKTKKSKHGKKNWRKNIDVSDIEKSQQRLNQEKIKKQSIKNLKDQDLFELDEPDKNIIKDKNDKNKDNSLLGQKTKREKKTSKQEARQIKRMIEISNLNANNKNKEEDKEKENQLYDLWGSDTKSKTNKNTSQLKYPKVPLPHPGQSYNPNKKDLNKLLSSVVENNKYLIKEEEPNENDNIEGNIFDDVESEEITKPVANNEPVSDTNRLTKKQKRQKEIKKANKLINKQQEEQKRIKIAINNALGAKKIAKEQKKIQEILEKKKNEEKQKEKIKNYEIKKGIINDSELLEDFQVNKNPVPLRRMKEEINPLSERWNNILKRNMIGEYTTKIRRPGNRKLRKIKYMDIDGPLDYLEDQDNFDIVE